MLHTGQLSLSFGDFISKSLGGIYDTGFQVGDRYLVIEDSDAHVKNLVLEVEVLVGDAHNGLYLFLLLSDQEVLHGLLGLRKGKSLLHSVNLHTGLDSLKLAGNLLQFLLRACNDNLEFCLLGLQLGLFHLKVNLGTFNLNLLELHLNCLQIIENLLICCLGGNFISLGFGKSCLSFDKLGLGIGQHGFCRGLSLQKRGFGLQLIGLCQANLSHGIGLDVLQTSCKAESPTEHCNK